MEWSKRGMTQEGNTVMERGQRSLSLGAFSCPLQKQERRANTFLVGQDSTRPVAAHCVLHGENYAAELLLPRF
jgi:hypothetical protein